MKQIVLRNLSQAQIDIAKALEAAKEGQRQAAPRGDGDLSAYQSAINAIFEASYKVRDALAISESIKQ
jgi:hypothetical protein